MRYFYFFFIVLGLFFDLVHAEAELLFYVIEIQFLFVRRCLLVSGAGPLEENGLEERMPKLLFLRVSGHGGRGYLRLLLLLMLVLLLVQSSIS